MASDVTIRNAAGDVLAVYDDLMADLLPALGAGIVIRRASYVEPDGQHWQADLAPVSGPTLRGFVTRQAALDAERTWLRDHLHV